MAKKTLHIKTYGCQMNVYDSARMADVLTPLGYEMTEDPMSADMVILNTCHIRERAAEKVYSQLGRLRKAKEAMAEQGRDKIIAVAGCVAQAEGEEIAKRAPYVDMVFGPQTYHQLPEMVAQASRAGGRVLNTDFPEESKFDHMGDVLSKGIPGEDGSSAFLTVQEGCDKFCTYCVVPYTRGAEFSRPAASVLAEARELASRGAKEITLLGQNVNAYHGESSSGSEWSLGRLIRELADVDGVERIRYMTSYPADVDDDLITAHRDVPKLMPFLHLPVQAGSDRILKAMNRRHTADEYRRVIDKLRDAQPDLALSSDFIVGFPGETDADFAETLKIVGDVTFIQAYSFKYSPRPGTPAAAMEFQVEESVMRDRLAQLQDVLRDQQQAFNLKCEGRTMDVLLDRRGKTEGQLAGRSPYMQPVIVEAPESLLGDIVSVKIRDGHALSLQGELTNSQKLQTRKMSA